MIVIFVLPSFQAIPEILIPRTHLPSVSRDDTVTSEFQHSKDSSVPILQNALFVAWGELGGGWAGSVPGPSPDVVVLDVGKVPEVVEEVALAVARVLLRPRVVAQVVVGARVVEGAALDHVEVARAEDLVVAVVAAHRGRRGHALVALLARARVRAVFSPGGRNRGGISSYS